MNLLRFISVLLFFGLTNAFGMHIGYTIDLVKKDEAKKMTYELIKFLSLRDKPNSLVQYTKTLLEKGADPNGNETGIPILIVLQKDWNDVLPLLLAHGVNINKIYDYGQTALMKAIRANNFDGARMLIEHGADVNISDSSKDTPLMIACLKGNKQTEELIELLLNHNANVNAQNSSGRTALMNAVISNAPYPELKIRIIKRLIKAKAQPNLVEKDGDNALLLAVDHQLYDVVQLLLEDAQADPNAADPNMRNSPLLRLVDVETPNIPLIRLFLEHKANVNFQNANKETALIRLFKNVSLAHHPETVLKIAELLLTYEANPNLQDILGNTALSYGAKAPSHILKLLLDYGADPTKSVSGGLTPLHVAAQNGRTENVKLLIEYAKKWLSNIALDKIANPQGSSYFNLLPADVVRTTQVYSEQPVRDFINSVDIAGNTALLLAAQHGHTEIVKLLLQNGADKNIKNKAGYTALNNLLMYAAPLKEYSEIIKLLKDN